MADGFEAIVVGAGVIGCSIALGLAQQGRRVLVVDKGPAAGYGSTSSSMAVIRTYYSTLPSTQLAWESVQVWRDWAGFLGAPRDASEGTALAEYRETGSLFLLAEDEPLPDDLLAHQDALGLPYDVWDEATVEAKMPWLDRAGYAPPRRHDDPDFGTPSGRRITRALYFPDSGYVTDPQLAARNLKEAAERHGAQFRFNVTVSEFLVRDGRAAGVQLADGETVDAPITVNAGGPWSSGLNRLAGVEAGMAVRNRPYRQEVAAVPVPAGMAESTTAGVGLMADPDIGNYARTDVSGRLMIGSIGADCDPPVWEDDPDTFDRSHTDQWTAQVYRQGLRMPDLAIPGQASGIVDLYDVTDDWMPIYDQTDLPGFYMACGTSGNQFKNAPMAGQLMAGLVAWCEAGHDHDTEPFHFMLPRTGADIDLSTFSRLRRPAETSGNVIG